MHRTRLTNGIALWILFWAVLFILLHAWMASGAELQLYPVDQQESQYLTQKLKGLGLNYEVVRFLVFSTPKHIKEQTFFVLLTCRERWPKDINLYVHIGAMVIKGQTYLCGKIPLGHWDTGEWKI